MQNGKDRFTRFTRSVPVGPTGRTLKVESTPTNQSLVIMSL